MTTSFLQTLIHYAFTILPWFFVGSFLAYFIETRGSSKRILFYLGKFTPTRIIIATILGMISPLSIMSFIPVASSFVKKGVHPSLLFSFLMSERSFDLQSFFIIASFFGLKIAVISVFVIFLSLLFATICIKNDKISFRLKKKDTRHGFIYRQIRLFSIVLFGIVVSAACKTFIPSSIVYTYARDAGGSLVSALTFGFAFYFGPVITNYPLAKAFAELGMSMVGVFAYLTISPILNGVIFVMFSNIAGARLTAKFICCYAVCGLVLLFLLIPILLFHPTNLPVF